MAVSKRTTGAEQIDESELSFWERVAIRALADCLHIQRTPAFCAQIAAECADAMVNERRKRIARNVK
jgi:hypothetical protein